MLQQFRHLLTTITREMCRRWASQDIADTLCSGLLSPDAPYAILIAGEMSDEQTTTSFSTEFKREAAALVLDQGYSPLEASRSVGVVESVLRRWVLQLTQQRHGVTPQSKALTP